jgi:predicted Zn-dependent protease
MREQIEAAIQSSRADYTEIRLEEGQNTRVAFRGPDLETADIVIDRGGLVRCFVHGGGWGIATFNDLSDLVLQPHLRSAVSMKTRFRPSSTTSFVVAAASLLTLSTNRGATRERI